MSYWNPDFTDRDAVSEAHGRGSGVAVILAFLLLLQAAVVYFLESAFAETGLLEPNIWSAVGTVAMAVFALFVAWRFSVGEGAFVGAFLLLVLTLEIVLQAIDGEFKGVVLGAILAVGLLHAVRAAFAVRSAAAMEEASE